MERYAVIMAGGGGTRFWPLSRQKTPKQLLNLSGRDLMINETVDRMQKTISAENTFIVTNRVQANQMKEATAGRVPSEQILAEPSARNTAACIGYAAMEILKKHGDGILCVVPSDAYIRNADAFSAVLSRAIAVAEDLDKLVTIGITPTFPATGYGYIKLGLPLCEGVRNGDSFCEKPDIQTAADYLADGSYVWNSGMFIWKASTILRYFQTLLPDIYENLKTIGDTMGTLEEQVVLNKVYPTIRKISVDYGIMEHCDNVAVVPGEFGWSDVGSWDMLGTLHPQDNCGNVLVGDVLPVESKNCIVSASGRCVTLLGMESTIVVETPDAVLVCPRDRAQDIKRIVDALIENGRTELI